MTGRRSVAIALVVLVLAGLVAAGTFLAATRLGGGEANRTLNRLLKGHFEKIEDLQFRANGSRASIAQAFDALDQTLNAIREPAGKGIPRAKELWAGAPAAMDKAREANRELPKQTQDIVDEAGRGRTDIRKYFDSLKGEGELRYIEALDKALASLIDTQVLYSEMNQRLAEGFPEYETLFSRSDKFFKELAAKVFRSDAEGSQVYTLANSSLVDILAAFRLDLDRLEKAAAESGEKTKEAFSAATRLRPQE